MTGGFSFSEHMLSALRRHFTSTRITVIAAGRDSFGQLDMAFLHGAATRLDVDASDRPFPYTLRMPQGEFYDPSDYPDILAGDGSVPDSEAPDDASRDWVPGRFSHFGHHDPNKICSTMTDYRAGLPDQQRLYYTCTLAQR